MKQLLILTSLAASLWLCGASAPASEPDIALRLVLREAAGFQGVPEAGSPAVLIDVERTGDVWQRGWASSAAFGNSEREVRVDRAAVGAGKIEFALTVTQASLGAQTGERLKYVVTLAKDAQGAWAGAYDGALRRVNIKGAALAEIRPGWETEPGYRPLKLGEHPRLLFRQSQVASLRQKAQTPFGQLALTKLPDNAAGLALRHQLTGDSALAEEARKRVQAVMADAERGDKRVRSRWFGLRLEQVSLAYDMCYDAWPADFRAQVAEYLHGQLGVMFNQRNAANFDDHISWTLAGAHSPPILYGGGLAGLVLWGEKGAKPAPPAVPALLALPEYTVEPAKDFTPAKGAVVTDFESGELLRGWIYAGQVPQGGDALAALGGPAKVRPGAGTELTADGKTYTFEPLDETKGYVSNSLTANRAQVELTGPRGVVSFSVGYYYLVLRNNADRWVRFDTSNGSVEGYLAGVRAVGGDAMRLKAGLYPLLLVAPLGHVNPWGKVFMEPRFTELTPEEAQPVIAVAQAAHADAVRDWENDVAEWERTGGADPRFMRDCGHARALMALIFGETPGVGGLTLSDSGILAMDGPNKYAMAHRVAFGTNPTPLDDVAGILPYKMFVHTYRADGKALGLEANGVASFLSASYPDNSRPTAMDNFATLYRIVREDWKPAVLWAWNFHSKADTDEARWTKVLTSGSRDGWAYARPYGTFDTHPIYAFVNYPVDAKPKPPQDVMPLTWRAPGGGFFGFRNNWSGTDDEFITQFYSATPSSGAGTLRVIGLGQVWSHGLAASAPARFGENVVQLPDDSINESARAVVIDVETRADGSGSVTLDLNDVYSRPRTDNNDRVEPLYERLGGYRRPASFVTQGITGRRVLSVDYSGKSGAPCLMAIVDTIQGGGSKLWTWQIESKQEPNPPSTRLNPETVLFDGKQFPYKPGSLLKREIKTIENDPAVKVTDKGFTLAQGDATLVATFIAPVTPKVQLAQRVEYRQGVKASVARNTSKAIFVEGGNDFLVVLTIQRGAAPAVNVAGKGLSAKIEVGQQTVRFDGQKVSVGL